LLISGSHLNAWVPECVQKMGHLQLHDINQEKLAYKDGVSGDETGKLKTSNYLLDLCKGESAGLIFEGFLL
jgi:hypothetical protein